MACNQNPRPSFTPDAQGLDPLVYQFVAHACPALDSEIRLLNRWRTMVNTILGGTSLNVTQRSQLTFILDQLFRRGLIYHGAEDGHLRDGDGRFIGGLE